MNRNQQNSDLSLRRLIDLQAVISWLMIPIAHRLSILEREIVTALATSQISNIKAGPGQKTVLDNTLNDIDAMIRHAYHELLFKLNADLQRLADIEAEFERRKLEKTFGFYGLKDKPIAAAALLIQGAKIADWLSRFAGDLSFRIRSRVRDGVISQLPMASIIDTIKGTSIDSPATSVFKQNENTLESTLRTAASEIANETSLEAAKNNGELANDEQTPQPDLGTPQKSPTVIRYGWQQISILDSRTTEICRRYAFKIWDRDFQPIGHDLPFNGGPPRHFYCRSRVVLILLDDEPIKEQSFTQWLQSQTPAEQAKVFPAPSLALWNAGKMNDSGLLSTAQQMTFEELKSRMP